MKFHPFSIWGSEAAVVSETSESVCITVVPDSEGDVEAETAGDVSV